MNEWVFNYIENQKRALDSIDTTALWRVVKLLEEARENDRQVFVFGNGGSGANASHFATDLGKEASDVVGPFRVLSLNDNGPWMTAIANDYRYGDVFARQLNNYARPKDIVISASVSGASPNLIEAFRLAKERGLYRVALVGGRLGPLVKLADESIVVDSEHYGRVEDCQMTILHMLCYAFVEKALDGATSHAG